MRVPRARTRKMLRKNPYPAEVAEQLGIDVSTVYRHGKDMDLKLLRECEGWSLKRIARLLLAELPASEVAKKLGVSPQYISQVSADDGRPATGDRKQEGVAA